MPQFRLPKKATKAPKVPSTADDFQQLADEHEETGKKWRAGDAAKGARGFLRAIESYNTGLSKYPKNFDLAYNRARVYVEFSQETRFLPYLPTPFPEFLRTAIEANRYALHLDPNNTDLLFNTGQALSGLAEELSERGIDRLEAIVLLAEALDLYTKCLRQQRSTIIQTQEAEQEAQMETDTEPDSSERPNDETEMDLDQSSEEGSTQNKVSATVIEPTTEDDIIDTALAKLSALTALCTMYDPSLDADASTNPDLNYLEHSASEIFDTDIPSLNPTEHPFPNSSLSRTTEILLVRASFATALSSAQYRANLIDASTYSTRINSTYASIPPPTTSSSSSSSTSTNPPTPSTPEILCAHADALTDLATTLLTRHLPSPSSPSSTTTTDPDIAPHNLRWIALTSAQDLLSRAAAAMPSSGGSDDAARRVRLYANKAEVELWRRGAFLLRTRASRNNNGADTKQGETEHEEDEEAGLEEEQARTAGTLAGNAAAFWRGAEKWARVGGGPLFAEGGGVEEGEFVVKAMVAEYVKTRTERREGGNRARRVEELARQARHIVAMGPAELGKMRGVLGEMVEEGLVSAKVAEGMVREVLGGET
ncbi:MAG: hypothetical protein M1821_007615 [Bathelium mastoideum]|nr:MAG: hypothetical protein M1821_007615 [Bathelium mastoideum]